jgi:hypothetical protein
MTYLVATRFNNDTWDENLYFRIRKNIDGCIYGTPKIMPSTIPLNERVIVLEMNNTTNKLEGVGMLRNIQCYTHYNIYLINNYNRYTYDGKYRIDREYLIKNNNDLLEIIEYILFKGKNNLKRGYGFTIINDKIIQKKIANNINIYNELLLIFKYIYKK